MKKKNSPLIKQQETIMFMDLLENYYKCWIV